MNKIVSELISITFVKVYKSNHSTSDGYLDKPVKPANFKVQVAQTMALNAADKNMRIRLELKLDGVDGKDKELGLHAEYGIEFQLHIDNLDQFLEDDNGITKVDGNMGATIMGIIYSTARGIIVERTQATYFNGVILPVISPKDLLGSNSSGAIS
jgi:hypothetical protein